jgi:DNA polymerase III subunit gamma/tau
VVVERRAVAGPGYGGRAVDRPEEPSVAYVSLYRRYRPGTFAEVVGQQHVIRTLVNAIAEDRLAHAYLFTGPRGTGKTSTARILAKAINCEAGPTTEPCGTCQQCTAITDGTSVDVIELDMASHGGVDDARELRDRALFAPASARRKVYILDEVHMASTAAFNALLKLIEEPPAHVLFAMATTDPQKVIPTILSRVQRLDLRRVSALEVAAHVRSICATEGYTIEDGAVDAVVRAGDGSVRDTLSILEQVLAFSGTDVTAEAVAQTLGQTPVDRMVEMVELLAARDVAGLLGSVQSLLDQGTDLRRFTLDLVQHLRDLLVLQAAPDQPALVDATDEHRRRLQAQTPLLPQASLLRAVDVLAATIAEQRQGAPRLPLELALAQLATPGADADTAELLDRIARLEAALAEGAGSRPAAPSTPPTRAREEPGARAEQEPATVPAEDATPTPGSADAEPGTQTADVEPEPASTETEPVAPDPEPETAAEPRPSTTAETEPVAADPELDEASSGDEAESEETPPADAPAPVAEAEPAAAPAVVAAEGDDDLATVLAHWEGVLERLKRGSRRHHAMVEPAVPASLVRGVLTLRYGARYASFHAVQARTGELDGAIRDAIAASCGLKVKLDVVIEGADERRRPMPPSVTPDDARTPVLDDGPAVQAGGAGDTSAPRASSGTAGDGDGGGGGHRASGSVSDTSPSVGVVVEDEGIEVREAELGGTSEMVDVDELVSRELGGQLVSERPAPGRDDA